MAIGGNMQVALKVRIEDVDEFGMGPNRDGLPRQGHDGRMERASVAAMGLCAASLISVKRPAIWDLARAIALSRAPSRKRFEHARRRIWASPAPLPLPNPRHGHAQRRAMPSPLLSAMLQARIKLAAGAHGVVRVGIIGRLESVHGDEVRGQRRDTGLPRLPGNGRPGGYP